MFVSMIALALGWDAENLDETSLLQAQMSKTRKLIEPSPGEGSAPLIRVPILLGEQLCVGAAPGNIASGVLKLHRESEASSVAPRQPAPAGQNATNEWPAAVAEVVEVQTSSDHLTNASAVLVVRYALLTATLLIFADCLRRAVQPSLASHPDDAAAPGEEPGTNASHACLMQAALGGDVARVEALIGLGADIRGADIWGSTALHAAARAGSEALVSRLVDLGAGVDLQDLWAETPLHVAARAGHAGVCELLVGCGAAIDAVNKQGWTALVVAGHESNTETCVKLQARNASAGDLSEDQLPLLLRPPAPEPPSLDVQVDTREIRQADVEAWLAKPLVVTDDEFAAW